MTIRKYRRRSTSRVKRDDANLPKPSVVVESEIATPDKVRPLKKIDALDREAAKADASRMLGSHQAEG